MPILVTDLGLQAIRNAGEGGFLVDLATFAVTPSTSVQLSVEDTGLHGLEVYRGNIQNIEAVGTSTVKLTLELPKGMPAAGQWYVNELGIYLATGELFAHGTFPATYTKTKEFSIKMYVYVTTGRLGELINITVASGAGSLPSSPNVRSLLRPMDALQNVVAVLDEQVNADGSSSASLAVKYGSGGLNWGFLGYTRVFHGVADTVTSPRSFSLDINAKGGFWLNDGETVLIQVTGGSGTGESRKAVYSASTKTFAVIEKDFTSLVGSSLISIWRNSEKNSVPQRKADIAPYMVLGVGVNSWTKDVFSTPSYSLTPTYLHIESTGAARYALTGSMAVSQVMGNFLVYVGGYLLPTAAYFVIGGFMSFPSVPPAGVSIDITYLDSIPSAGAEVQAAETRYAGDGSTSSFGLPSIPVTDASVNVYVAGKLISPNLYAVRVSKVYLQFSPADQVEVLLVLLTTYESAGSVTTVIRNEWQGDSSTTIFQLGTTIVEPSRLMLYVDGKYVPRTSYSVSPGRLEITNAANIPVFGASLVTLSTIAITDVAQSSVSGINTGPMWVDPAGVDGLPNTLVPVRTSVTTDGATVAYGVPRVVSSAYLLVFIAGARVSPSSYTYDRVSTTLTFKVAPAFGALLDVVSFTDVASTGSLAQCGYVIFSTLAGVLSYPRPAGPTSGVLVFINGAYQHVGSYSVSDNAISFSSVVGGAVVSVWVFNSIAHDGFRTYIDLDSAIASPTTLIYPIRATPTAVVNTLGFLSSMFIAESMYNLSSSSSGQTQVALTSALPESAQGLELTLTSFTSENPRPRLLLRAEADERYMHSKGQAVGWDSLSKNLRDMLACPLTKLLGMVSGSMSADLSRSNGSADSILLATKWGLAPVTKSVLMDVIPTANYSAVGPGAALGVPQVFNVYRYLEIYLKDILGTGNFAIKDWEKGTKYVIDAVNLESIQTEVIPRADIPMLNKITGIFTHYPSKVMSSTYPQMPLLTTFFDMEFSVTYCTLPDGFADTTSLRTVSASMVANDATQTKTFTHVVQSDYNGGGQHTISWTRPYITTSVTVDYLTLVSGGGAPGYMLYFARLYANYQYNDSDLRVCMMGNKTGGGVGGSAANDISWTNWLVGTMAGGNGGNYPAVAGYTEGLTFGVAVSNFNQTTGDASLSINITSGTIGYSYFPASALVKKITIPVTYTIYPGISVAEDGTITSVMSNADLFDSCCWSGYTPVTVIADCSAV